MLSRSTEAQLGQAIRQIQSKGGPQIAVLTIPDLSGGTIEQASIAVTDKWKLGTKNKDNGVLLLIAKKERQVRIEVGQGLEGSLTDAYSKRIVDEAMVPLFRSGSVDQGVLLGVAQIVQKTNPDLDVAKLFGGTSNRWKQRQRRRPGLASLFPLLLFFLLVFVLPRGRHRGSGVGYLLTGMLLGGMGGGRGGSGGFGGFGGGGGGFSGGGASGSW